MREHLLTLIERDKGLCHYCNNKTNNVKEHRRQATREHVFPKSFGGPDTLDNFVLACRECNNKRGTILHYCTCDLCSGIVAEALADKAVIDLMLAGMIKTNKVCVYKVVERKPNPWCARRNGNHRFFSSHKAALDYAYNGTFEKGK